MEYDLCSEWIWALEGLDLVGRVEAREHARNL